MFVCLNTDYPKMMHMGQFPDVASFVADFLRVYGSVPAMTEDSDEPGFWYGTHNGDLIIRPLAPTAAERAKSDAYNAKVIEEDALADTLLVLAQIVACGPDKAIGLDAEEVACLAYAIERLEAIAS